MEPSAPPGHFLRDAHPGDDRGSSIDAPTLWSSTRKPQSRDAWPSGKTIPSKVGGSAKWVYNDDGTITNTTTGATHRNALGAGLVSGFIGHERVVLVPTGEIDEDGFPIYDQTDDTQSGQFLGNSLICGILS
jgi:hypothetical protein